jgi:uncharacterized protein YgbK (DUF1537 family)
VTSGKLGIVADDLTGAMDSSGCFASMGLDTIVILDPSFHADANVLAITTDSRAESPEVASKRVKRAIKSMGGRVIYKKIDSTLRGNIGIELEAAIEELGSEKAIVAPAFPEMGRTTEAGIMQVKGVAVAKTQFAKDPILPVQESHIPTLLEQSTKCRVGCVTVEDIEAGPASLYCKIKRMAQNIVVCDVIKQSHLADIVQAAILAKGRWLLCGSSGLARELHFFLANDRRPKRMASLSLPSGPALLAISTRNQITKSQLIKAKNEIDLPILDLNLEYLNQKGISSAKVEKIVAEAERLLEQSNRLAISSASSPYVPALTRSIPVVMAEAVAAILDRRKFNGLFLSGGDIAVEVCRRLSVSAISLRGEVELSIPAGELIGGQFGGMRVVTKAGGFGTEAAIVKCLLYLEKGEFV